MEPRLQSIYFQQVKGKKNSLDSRQCLEKKVKPILSLCLLLRGFCVKTFCLFSLSKSAFLLTCKCNLV